MRILLLSGGSGGHISPALAIAPELRKLDPDAELTFVCSKSPLDISILRTSGEKFIPISSGKLRRYFSLQNFTDIFLIVLGFIESLFLLRKIRPHVIFSKGGFVSVPVAWAARIYKIPLVVHESDAVAGLANRLVSKGAVKVLTAFPTDFGEWAGTPVRDTIYVGDANRGKKFLGFTSDKPIVFVFAGSQGSQKLNSTLQHSLEQLSPEMNIVWITGNSAVKTDMFADVKTFPFLHEEFPHVLAAADVVVCRSGSNSLFEVAAAGKPMILIPHPHTGGDHQRKNAEVFVEKGAAEMILDRELNPEILARMVSDLLRNPEKRESLARNAAKLGHPDAARRIAEAVIAVGKGRK